jgi:phosphomannomutase/phosphoglucomutase
VNTIDGLRVEYPDGFGLMRASNTTPVIVLRFEADSDEALARIRDDFRRVLERARPGLPIPT